MTYRLDQSAVNRGDFAPAVAALGKGEVVDASGLAFSASRLAVLASRLPVAKLGGRVFRGRRFVGAHFGDGVALERCSFTGVSFDDATFGRDCSFRASKFSRAHFNGVRFGANADFCEVDFGTKASFHTARFGDGARFAHAIFVSTQFFSASFGDQASFRAARFRDRAKFGKARFGDRGNFTAASFPANADFGGAVFGEKFQMIGVTFGGDPSFLGASFGDRARLTGWHVEGSLIMRSTRFLGAMSLHGAQVGRDAVFDYSFFGDSADLGDLRAGGTGSFSSARFCGASRLGPLHAREHLLLSETLLEGSCVVEVDAPLVNMSRARLLGPVRLVVRRGDVVLDSVDSESRFVVTAPTDQTDQDLARVVSVRGMDLSGVVVSGLDVRPLRFQGAENIDRLRLESGARFQSAPRGLRVHREVIAEEHLWQLQTTGDTAWYPAPCRPQQEIPGEPPDEAELARVYRGLRKSREDAKDAPGASDFYYGEMDMRRRQARGSLTTFDGLGAALKHIGETVLLELYRLGGGYGVRPLRPFLLLVALVLLGGLAADCWDLISYRATASTPPKVVAASFEQSLVFVVRSALLLPAPPRAVLALGADVLQITARVLGPLLIGLVALGLRARVKR